MVSLVCPENEYVFVTCTTRQKTHLYGGYATVLSMQALSFPDRAGQTLTLQNVPFLPRMKKLTLSLKSDEILLLKRSESWGRAHANSQIR